MLAKTPPMGWNSWNTFGTNINESVVMGIADVMAEKGYKDVGYEYVVIDDGWSSMNRDEDGRLVADPEKFPHGMKYLADYIHSKGLKFGIYSCAGVKTCGGYPGSGGHEYEDAKLFAEWEVDFLKYDFCYFPENGDAKQAYLTMSMALKASGREMLFSACNWGVDAPWKWMRSIGAHMYRSTGDIFDSYKSYTDIILSQQENWCMSAPGCFNDPDMLIVGMYGNGYAGIESGCTDVEYESHFAWWCMTGAPLMIGGDIRNINPFCEKLLKNKLLISIDQDEEARPPFMVGEVRTIEDGRIFVKHLSKNRFAIGFFKEKNESRTLLFDLRDAGIPYQTGITFDVTDAMTGEHLGIIDQDSFYCKLPEHGCKVFIAEFAERKDSKQNLQTDKIFWNVAIE